MRFDRASAQLLDNEFLIVDLGECELRKLPRTIGQRSQFGRGPGFGEPLNKPGDDQDAGDC